MSVRLENTLMRCAILLQYPTVWSCACGINLDSPVSFYNLALKISKHHCQLVQVRAGLWIQIGRAAGWNWKVWFQNGRPAHWKSLLGVLFKAGEYQIYEYKWRAIYKREWKQRRYFTQFPHCFLERDLGFLDARSVEIQRVHRIGKRREDKPRPILARFLRYKDCQKILSLGHRLQGTNYQMFRDLPNEIINGRKKQLETLKAARKNGIPAAFSASEPDKLFIRGKLWPVGQELIPSWLS